MWVQSSLLSPGLRPAVATLSVGITLVFNMGYHPSLLAARRRLGAAAGWQMLGGLCKRKFTKKMMGRA